PSVDLDTRIAPFLTIQTDSHNQHDLPAPSTAGIHMNRHPQGCLLLWMPAVEGPGKACWF
ncbi:MAG: hypothetical protein ACKOUR_01460, partial [Planctomycetota bacterium]